MNAHGEAVPRPGGCAPESKRRQRQAGRLHSGLHYQHVRNTGRAFSGRFMVVRVAAAADGCGRLGIVTSRRFSGLAVERNRARRLLRDGWRHLCGRLGQPAWVVLLPRQAIKGIRLPALLPEMGRLLVQAGLCTTEPDATS